MAGLLDALNSEQGLLGLALLQAASPKPVRTGLGEGLLQGVQLVQQDRNAREDRAESFFLGIVAIGTGVGLGMGMIGAAGFASSWTSFVQLVGNLIG